MFSFLSGVFFEIAVPVVVVLIFGGGEWLLKQAGKRFWMWVLGAVWIAFVIWFRGPAEFSTWIIAVGWLGMLAWFDAKMHKPAVADVEPSAEEKEIDGRRY
jgi:hypothetical protein